MQERTLNDLLADIHEKNQISRKRAGGPEVGIFWDFNGKLLCMGLPLSDAQDYGIYKTYPGGHDQVWKKFQEIGTVPMDVEYDAVPRGRSVYDSKKRKFVLYVDLCINADKAIMGQIMRSLHLRSANTEVAFDEHYVCPGCTRVGIENEDEE